MFHSFKAGIEALIFSFKWHKNIFTDKKFDTYQLELLTDYSPQTNIINIINHFCVIIYLV